MESFRPLAQSFKYLSAKDLILRVRAVCGHWRKVANSPDVLLSILEAEDIDIFAKTLPRTKDILSAFEAAFKRHKVLYTIHTHNVYGNFYRSRLLRISVLSGKLTTERILDRHYCLLQLKSNQLFLCGAYIDTCSSAVLLYDPNTKVLAKLPDMREAKTNCCLVEHLQCVYVFGGSKEYLNLTSADRFLLEKGVWEALPDLPVPVYQFSPVSYQESIFLLAPDWKCVLEFDPERKQYQRKSRTLEGFDISETDVFSFLEKDQWMLVSKGVCLGVRLQGETMDPQRYEVPVLTPVSRVLKNNDSAYLVARTGGQDALMCIREREGQVESLVVTKLNLRI
jgi:hypothetical protein